MTLDCETYAMLLPLLPWSLPSVLLPSSQWHLTSSDSWALCSVSPLSCHKYPVSGPGGSRGGGCGHGKARQRGTVGAAEVVVMVMARPGNEARLLTMTVRLLARCFTGEGPLDKEKGKGEGGRGAGGVGAKPNVMGRNAAHSQLLWPSSLLFSSLLPSH